MAMVAASEFHHLISAGKRPCQTQRGHSGFRTRIYKSDHFDRGYGRGSHFSQGYFQLGRGTEASTVFGRLF